MSLCFRQTHFVCSPRYVYPNMYAEPGTFTIFFASKNLTESRRDPTMSHVIVFVFEKGMFTPQLSVCGRLLAVCLSPRCEALLSLSLRGGGRFPSLFQGRRPNAVCVLYSPALSLLTPPADSRLPALLRMHSVLLVLRLDFRPRSRSSLRSPRNTCERSSLSLAVGISVS